MLRRKATLPEPQAPEDAETGPLRRCLVTRTQAARETMLRFVVGPGDALVFDVGATLPGRGFWLSAGPDVIHQAIRRGVFSRAAKRGVSLPPDLPEKVAAALRQRIFDSCALARRSGHAISGFEKAREWLVSGKAALVLQAMDGSPEERARFLGARNLPVVTALTGADLGKIFGREQTVHAVIAAGRLAQKIQIDADRLRGVAGDGVHGQ